MGFLEDKLAAGPFSSIADKLAHGSPMGSAGMAYGKNIGLEGDRLNQFASVIANDRDLYNQMALSDFMKQREIDQLSFDTQRNAYKKLIEYRNKSLIPLLPAYNPAMNPFLNSGIGNFQFFV